MEECVKARDAYLNDGGFLNLKNFWVERGFEDTYGTTYSSYHRYARNDTTKRRKLNTRLGSHLGGESMLDAVVAEAMQQEEAEPEEPDAGCDGQNLLRPTMKSYWSTLLESYDLVGKCLGQNYLDSQRQKRESREQKQYRLMGCAFGHRYRSPGEKQRQLDYWKDQGIPMYCSITGANTAWMEAEVSLLEECNEISGTQEVYYRGPMLGRELSQVWSQESSDAGKEATPKRRKRMRDGINKYSLIQLRHVLVMKEKGGTAPPEVLFALDKLLEWYDDWLQSKGFEPSGLCRLLREHNFQRRVDLRKQTNKKATGETHSHLKVPGMIISPEEKKTLCKQMSSTRNGGGLACARRGRRRQRTRWSGSSWPWASLAPRGRTLSPPTSAGPCRRRPSG